jgi:hypothetical protein
MTNKKPARKLLIVLSYWEGDRLMTRSVAELIADLEPKLNEKADILFYRRYDAQQMPNVLIDKMADKFGTVKQLKCRRMNAVGYPYGPNEMFYDLLEQMNSREWQTDYYAFLNMEADCVPLTTGWIEKLLEEFGAAYNEGKFAVGHVVQVNPGMHLNGSALYSTDFWQHAGGMNMIGGPAASAYDIYHANRILPIAKDTASMLLDFNRKTITEDDLFALRKHGEQPVYLHGVKDMSAILAVRNKFIQSNGQVNLPTKLKTIMTYYDIDPDNNPNVQNQIIEMWKKTWTRFGYNPVVLTEWDATKHPEYDAIKSILKNLKTDSHRKTALAKFYRWLAFDYTGGGLYTEYDVFPNSMFTTEDIPQQEAVNLLETNDLSAVKADRAGLKFLIETIKDHDYSSSIMMPSDKDIILKDKTAFWLREQNTVSPWSYARWSEAHLVHFSYKACKNASASVNKPMIIEQYLKTVNP